jgi:hypothetical protein
VRNARETVIVETPVLDAMSSSVSRPRLEARAAVLRGCFFPFIAA